MDTKGRVVMMDGLGRVLACLGGETSKPAPDPEAEKRRRIADLRIMQARRLVPVKMLDTTGDLFDRLQAKNPLLAVPSPQGR